jgi:uncharacterized protein YndB with AHSA1/START domain
MKWVYIALGSIAVLIAIIAVVGSLLPRSHTASRTITLRRRPEELWRVLADYESGPSWRSDIKSVELLPAREGRPCWREMGGHDAITYVREEEDPPRRLVNRIADENLAFGGSWTFAVDPAPEGSTLTVTENGEVYNPFFRFISSFVIGHHANIDSFLKALERRMTS